jgi:hypothetical protein
MAGARPHPPFLIEGSLDRPCAAITAHCCRSVPRGTPRPRALTDKATIPKRSPHLHSYRGTEIHLPCSTWNRMRQGREPHSCDRVESVAATPATHCELREMQFTSTCTALRH